MQKRKIQDYPDISVRPETLCGQLDFNTLFDRIAPLHIEIGSGKGTFILAQAQAYPEINFFGMEWANRYYRLAVDRLGRWGISNVKMLRTDAAQFVADHIADEVVECFHLYFPDPWHKKKHNKRRFFCDENVVQLLRCLKQGGIINIATDHADYFEQMVEVVDRQLAAGTIEKIDFIRAAGAQEGEYVGTNFERKYKKQGRPTYTIAMRKI